MRTLRSDREAGPVAVQHAAHLDEQRAAKTFSHDSYVSWTFHMWLDIP